MKCMEWLSAYDVYITGTYYEEDRWYKRYDFSIGSG